MSLHWNWQNIVLYLMRDWKKSLGLQHLIWVVIKEYLQME
jgi:hypothetical protein